MTSLAFKACQGKQISTDRPEQGWDRGITLFQHTHTLTPTYAHSPTQTFFVGSEFTSLKLKYDIFPMFSKKSDPKIQGDILVARTVKFWSKLLFIFYLSFRNSNITKLRLLKFKLTFFVQDYNCNQLNFLYWLFTAPYLHTLFF